MDCTVLDEAVPVVVSHERPGRGGVGGDHPARVSSLPGSQGRGGEGDRSYQAF